MREDQEKLSELEELNREGWFKRGSEGRSGSKGKLKKSNDQDLKQEEGEGEPERVHKGRRAKEDTEELRCEKEG